MAKLSERHLREEKVKKLKTKVLSDISEYKGKFQDYLLSYHEDRSELTDELFEDYISEIYGLMHLEKFIARPSTFMLAAAVEEDQDYIAYYVDDRDLDIWLRDDYHFVDQFMLNLTSTYGGPFKLLKMLSEDYFAYNFTNIFDHIIFDKEMGEKNEPIN